jgi:hypothetical protein
MTKELARRDAAPREIGPEELAERRKQTMKGSPRYSDEYMVKMANLVFDPMALELCAQAGIKDEGHLLGLTRINSSKEAFYWARQITMEAAYNRDTSPELVEKLGDNKWPLSKVFRVSFLLMRRSLDMKGFMLGVGLAQEQSIMKTEDTGEGSDWS